MTFEITSKFLENLSKLIELKKKDPRICIIQKINSGVCDARNAGYEIALGAFITFLDADDVWEHVKNLDPRIVNDHPEFQDLKPFIGEVYNSLEDTDIDRLLEIKIRKISRFDINQNRKEN